MEHVTAIVRQLKEVLFITDLWFVRVFVECLVVMPHHTEVVIVVGGIGEGQFVCLEVVDDQQLTTE